MGSAEGLERCRGGGAPSGRRQVPSLPVAHRPGPAGAAENRGMSLSPRLSLRRPWWWARAPAGRALHAK